MLDKEYEILPADELAKLRHEVEMLKAHPFSDSQTGKTLQESVENLTSAINRLIKVFSDVEQDMIDEYKDQKTVNQHLFDINNQNQKIASGIVALADKLDGLKQKEIDSHSLPKKDNLSTPIEPSFPSTPNNNSGPVSSPSNDFFPNPPSQNPLGTKAAFDSPPPLNDPFGQPNKESFVPPSNNLNMPPMPPPQKKKRFGLFR